MQLHTLSHDCSHLIGLPRFSGSDTKTWQELPDLPSLPPQYFTKGQYVACTCIYMDKTGHISNFFSNKPHCNTTMGK